VLDYDRQVLMNSAQAQQQDMTDLHTEQNTTQKHTHNLTDRDKDS